jgi:hypothetical protein
MLYKQTRFSEKVPAMIGLQKLLALGGGLLAAAQAVLIVFQGDILCLNEGCEIVEKLTTVPPIIFNIAGALFFLTLFLALWQGARGIAGWLGLARLLLLAGMTAEGVLIGFQYYVAEAFCSYCLIIFSIIALLNLLAGWRQVLAAAAVFGAVLLAFASLHFTPQSESQGMALDKGVYARLEKQQSGSELYLFFSSTCPHCEDVIATIDTAFTCSLNFNPIDNLESAPLPDLVMSTEYSPAINRGFLKNIGISEIPALVIKREGEIRILKGKQLIGEYLAGACRFSAVPVYDATYVSGSSGQSPVLPFFSTEPQQDACTVEEDCEEGTEGKAQEGSGQGQ